jgi:hypothetical protein
MAAIGLGGFSAISGISAAKEQAKAIAEEGAIAADNKKIETMRKAGAARASFLNSGFDIFGTPESAIGGIYDTGKSDIGRIISNANRKSKSTVSAAVGKAFADMATMAAGASMGGGFGGAENAAGSVYNTPFGSVGGASGSNFGSFTPTPVANPRGPWLT